MLSRGWRRGRRDGQDWRGRRRARGSGPVAGPWPASDHSYDPELLRDGDRRNVVDRYRYWTHRGDRRRPRHPAARLPRRDRELAARLQHRHGRPHRQRVPRRGGPHRRASAAGTGAARWSPTATSTCATTRTVADLVAWAAGRDGGLPLVGIDNLPGLGAAGDLRPARGRACCSSARRARACPSRAREPRATAVLASRSSARPARSTPAPRRRSRCTPGSAGTSRPAPARPARGAPERPARHHAARAVRGSPPGGGNVPGSAEHDGAVPRTPPAIDHAGVRMPIATPEVYAEMLDRAKAGSLRLPGHQRHVLPDPERRPPAASPRPGATASSRSPPAAPSTSSGPTIKDMVTGSLALAAYAARGRQELPRQHRAAHRPLPQGQARRLRPPAARDLAPSGSRPASTRSFQSHMWDGSAVPLEENLADRPGAARRCAAAANIILEVEIGVVGGEEDGVDGAINDKLYTTVEDALATVEALGLGEKGRYMTALTFGNVHGVYKPGNVKLRPEILKEIQEAVVAKLGLEAGAKPVRPGLPRRLRLHRRGDRRRGRLRRRQDEHRHRHPVRLHPPGRRPHVHATTTAC